MFSSVFGLSFFCPASPGQRLITYLFCTLSSCSLPPFNTFVLFYKSKSGHIQTCINSLFAHFRSIRRQRMQCRPATSGSSFQKLEINYTSGDVNKPNIFLLLKFWRQQVCVMFHFVWLCVLYTTQMFPKSELVRQKIL